MTVAEAIQVLMDLTPEELAKVILLIGRDRVRAALEMEVVVL